MYSAESYYQAFHTISQTLPASLEDNLTYNGLIDLMYNCNEVKNAEKQHSTQKLE